MNNVAQIDGFSFTQRPLPPEPERLAAVDAFIVATNANIRHGGDRACFVRALDLINLPPVSSLKTTEPYYATALHELGHNADIGITTIGRGISPAWIATSPIASARAPPPPRNWWRSSPLRFCAPIWGSPASCAMPAISPIGSTSCATDDRAIFTVASKASQAADYPRSFSETRAPQ